MPNLLRPDWCTKLISGDITSLPFAASGLFFTKVFHVAVDFGMPIHLGVLSR
jgi:hypothetical protein